MRLLALLLAAVATSSAAQMVTDPGGGLRVQTVEYRTGQIVLLQAALGYQVTIEFAPDEQIETVAIGDSGAWQAMPNKRGDLLVVKPSQAGVATNMTVVTDARQYLFDLQSYAQLAQDMAYVVRFAYPSAAAADGGSSGSDVPEPRPGIGRYRLSGARMLRPLMMEDDGIHTYIAWQPDRTLPAVYALDFRGRETLVNGMMRDGVLVIDSVAQTLVFRLDRRTARAIRRPVKAVD